MTTTLTAAELHAGMRFGRLTIEQPAPRRYWRCRCACGTVKLIRRDHLLSGRTASCGCLIRDIASVITLRHGATSETATAMMASTYRIWRSMRTRCENSKCKAWPRYGGRGIKVCYQWRDYRNFLADMGERPKGMSIDRINNDGNYEPNNCRWATLTQQARNASTTIRVVHNGKESALRDMLPVSAVCYSTLRYRIQHGWPVALALAEPSRKD